MRDEKKQDCKLGHATSGKAATDDGNNQGRNSSRTTKTAHNKSNNTDIITDHITKDITGSITSTITHHVTGSITSTLHPRRRNVFFCNQQSNQAYGGLNASPLITINMWQPQVT
jgi:hypothetical protein